MQAMSKFAYVIASGTSSNLGPKTLRSTIKQTERRPSSLLVGLVVIERWSHSQLYFGVAGSFVNDCDTVG